MKFLLKTKEKSELDRIRMLLESRGVLVHVDGENEHRLGGHAMPFIGYRLHVVVDAQYEDALKLLEDEEHEVADPVDMDEFRAYQEEARPEVMNRIINWMVLAVIGLLAVVFLMYQLAAR
jgi:hypothetical protein